MESDGKRWRCAACQRDKRAAEWSDPEKQARNRAAGRRAKLQRVYGLAESEWDALYVAQNGHCPICKSALAERHGGEGKQAAVDHDHRTGLIRGLLCAYPCNYTLGLWRDDADKLTAAAAYVQAPPAVSLFGLRAVPKQKKRKKKRKKLEEPPAWQLGRDAA